MVKFSPKEVSSNDQRIYKNYNLVIKISFWVVFDVTCKNFFKGFFAPTMSLLKKDLPSSVLSLHQEPGLLSILKSCVQKKQEVRLIELLGCIKSLYCRHLRFHTNLSIKNKKVFSASRLFLRLLLPTYHQMTKYIFKESLPSSSLST